MPMLRLGGLKLERLERKKLARQAKIGEEVDASSLLLNTVVLRIFLGAEPRPAREDRKFVLNKFVLSTI
jgi:hypothetical protein